MRSFKKTMLLHLVIVIIAAAAGISIFVYSGQFMKNYFRRNLTIAKKLQGIQININALESEILKNGSFLYRSYDTVHYLLKNIDNYLEELHNNEHLQKDHSENLAVIDEFAAIFRQYSDWIERYLTLNASLKNSLVYIPTLQLKAYQIFNASEKRDREVLELFSKVSAIVSMSKNTLDSDFMDEIRSYSNILGSLYESDMPEQKKRLIEAVNLHMEHFIKTFPKYVDIMEKIFNSNIKEKSNSILKAFRQSARNELLALKRFTATLFWLYILSLFTVIFFIFKTQKENLRLVELKRGLEKSLLTDRLTGLGNRTAFVQRKRKLLMPCLIIINIDRFKHINGFYGSDIGDEVLRQVADKIRSVTPEIHNTGIFRLGGDDFGILCEMKNNTVDLKGLIQYYLASLEAYSIEIEDLHIDLSFTIGASTEKNRLFETADMALKHAKNLSRKNFAVYDLDIDKTEEIARNINTTKKIKKALAENGVIPYFQPLYDIKNKKISKFEALARIDARQGSEVLSPNTFMNIAKEVKLSGTITLKILHQTIKISQKYPYGFTVNISAEDIENSDERKKIYEFLEKYKNVNEKIVFEILESEDINDYDEINNFIKTVKRYGCKVAIDDFGSGYSNYEKILKLDIDFLKIDGSLIKKIDHDEHAELIVRTILDFARNAKFETIAEFVHSREVYNKVVEMGFDYAQGYYIGKPEKEPAISNDTVGKL